MTDPARLAEAHTIVGDLMSRCHHVLLAFSGGKESLVLAHMLMPWRDRVTLVWVNTGDGPPGMADFVRGYGRCFDLVELPRDPRASWAEFGPPADVVPARSAQSSSPGPRLQPWSMCCWRNRNDPLYRFILEAATDLQERGMTTAHINGQRHDDLAHTKQELRAVLPLPETVWPLWDWSEEDVMCSIATKQICLPPHYAEVRSSMDCMSCPADVTRDRIAYLDRNYPAVAANVRRINRAAREISRAALDTVEAGLVAR